MTFYGDPYRLTHWPEVIVVPMPTALLRFYTPEGFVLASDGLLSKINDDGSTIPQPHSIQKIFRVGQGLAYSLTGISQLGANGSDGIAFDFITAVRLAVRSMRAVKSKDLNVYVTNICRSINTALSAAKRSGSTVRYPTDPMRFPGERGDTIVTLYFDGYYEGLPSSVRARFLHENQRLVKAEVDREQLDQIRICGSRVIGNLLFNSEDPRFAAYRRPKVGPTLTAVIEMSRNYLRACADPELRKLDEKACALIGGDTQVAAITPTTGFYWVQRLGAKSTTPEPDPSC